MSEYVIYKSDGTELCRVKENTFDTESSSVTLIGKGITDYGESQNSNFIHMLDNFANTVSPNSPLRGQIWFKEYLDALGAVSSSFDLMINNSLNDIPVWQQISVIEISADEPVGTTTGRLWYNTDTKVLYIYDDGAKQWIEAGVENYLHVKNFHTELFMPSQQSITDPLKWIVPNEYIIRDLQSDLEKMSNLDGQGVLNEIEYSILGKECYEGSTKTVTSSVEKAVAFSGTAIVQSIKNLDGISYNVMMLGGPIKNRLATSEGADDWDVKLEIVGNNLEISVFGQPQLGKTHISWLINLRITAV